MENILTHEEIKKLYTKTKRAYEKRTGDKYTWVMNAKQQNLGTATICTGSVQNLEKWAAELSEYISGGGSAKQATKTWKHFQAKALEEERTGGASWDPYFWRKPFEAMGTLEERIAAEIAKDQARLDERLEQIDRLGSMSRRIRRAKDEASEMIGSPEIQSFLAAVNGSAEIELVTYGDGYLVYIRFHY